jgi:hypothetical protein
VRALLSKTVQTGREDEESLVRRQGNYITVEPKLSFHRLFRQDEGTQKVLFEDKETT